MFKLRTLTICFKLRVVVTVLWVVSRRVLHLLSCHHLPFSAFSLRRGSGSFQFPPVLLTSFQAIRNMVLTWNEKKNSQGIYTKNKSSTWPLSSLHENKKLCEWDPFPSQPLLKDTVTLREIIQNTVHHVLFYFT